MVEATIKNLDSINRDTSKQEVKKRNLEVIEAAKEKVNEEVSKVVSDLEEAKKALATMEDAVAAEKIATIINEAITQVQRKKTKFQKALGALSKENKSKKISEEILTRAKTQGTELFDKYQEAKTLHNEQLAKKSVEDTSETIPKAMPEERVTSSQAEVIEQSEPVVIGVVNGGSEKNVEDEKSGGKNAESAKSDNEKAVVDSGQENVDKDLKEFSGKVYKLKKEFERKLDELTERGINLKGEKKKNEDISKELYREYSNFTSLEDLKLLKDKINALINLAKNKIVIDNEVLNISRKLENGRYKTDQQIEVILAEAKRLAEKSSDMIDIRQVLDISKDLKKLEAELDLRIIEINTNKKKVPEVVTNPAPATSDVVEGVIKDKPLKNDSIMGGKDLDKSSVEIPVPNKLINRALPNSVEYMKKNYSDENPIFLKKFEDKHEFSEEDKKDLIFEKNRLESRIEAIKGIDKKKILGDKDFKKNVVNEGPYGEIIKKDRGLRNAVYRMVDLALGKNWADAEVYKDDLVEIFNNGLEKLKQVEERMEKTVLAGTAQSESAEADDGIEKISVESIEKRMEAGEAVTEITLFPNNKVRVKKIYATGEEKEVFVGKQIEGEVFVSGGKMPKVEGKMGIWDGEGEDEDEDGDGIATSTIEEIKKCNIDGEKCYLIKTRNSFYRLDILDEGKEGTVSIVNKKEVVPTGKIPIDIEEVEASSPEEASDEKLSSEIKGTLVEEIPASADPAETFKKHEVGDDADSVNVKGSNATVESPVTRDEVDNPPALIDSKKETSTATKEWSKEELRRFENSRIVAECIKDLAENFEDLNAEDDEKRNEKFKKVAKELWRKFAVHGMLNKEGKLVENSDLDGNSAIGLLSAAKINVRDRVYTEKGSSVKGRTNIDNSNPKFNINGFYYDKDTGTLTIDHHGDASKRDSSATKNTYEVLVDLGLLEKTEALDKLVKFVTHEDNKTFHLDEADKRFHKDKDGNTDQFSKFSFSYRTMEGLSRYVKFNKLKEFFENGREDDEILTEEDLKKYGLIENIKIIPPRVAKRNNLEEADLLAENLAPEIKEKLAEQNIERKKNNDEKTKERWPYVFIKAVNRLDERKEAIQKSKEQIASLEERGFTLESQKYGKIIITAGNSNIACGEDAIRGLGYDTYVRYTAGGSFMVTTKNGFEEGFLEDVDGGEQGKVLREAMWSNNGVEDSKNLLLEDILKRLVGGDFEATGGLKEFLDNERDEELSSKIKATPLGELPVGAAIDLGSEISSEDLAAVAGEGAVGQPTASEEVADGFETFSQADLDAMTAEGGDDGAARRVVITDNGQELEGEDIEKVVAVEPAPVEAKEIGEAEIKESSDEHAAAVVEDASAVVISEEKAAFQSNLEGGVENVENNAEVQLEVAAVSLGSFNEKLAGLEHLSYPWDGDIEELKRKIAEQLSKLSDIEETCKLHMDKSFDYLAGVDKGEEVKNAIAEFHAKLDDFNSKVASEIAYLNNLAKIAEEPAKTQTADILSQDEAADLLAGAKIEGGEGAEKYSPETAGDLIDSANSLAVLDIVVKEIANNNLELLTKGGAEKGTESALKQLEKYFKKCDPGIKGHTPYFKNYFDGECGLKLLDKVKAIKLAQEKGASVEISDDITAGDTPEIAAANLAESFNNDCVVMEEKILLIDDKSLRLKFFDRLKDIKHEKNISELRNLSDEIDSAMAVLGLDEKVGSKDKALKQECADVMKKINELSRGINDFEFKKEISEDLKAAKEATNLEAKLNIYKDALAYVNQYLVTNKNLAEEFNSGKEGADAVSYNSDVEREVGDTEKLEGAVPGLFVEGMNDEEYENQVDDLERKLLSLNDVVDKDKFEVNPLKYSDFIAYRDAKNIDELNILLSEVNKRLELAMEFVLGKKVVAVVSEINNTMEAGVKDQDFKAKIKAEKAKIYNEVEDSKDFQKAFQEYKRLLGKINEYIANQVDPVEEKRKLSVEESGGFLVAAREVHGRFKDAIEKIEDEEFKKRIEVDKSTMYAELKGSDDFELILEKYQDFLARINNHLREEARQRNLTAMKDLIREETDEPIQAAVDVENYKGLDGQVITLPEFKDGVVEIGKELKNIIREEMLKKGLLEDQVDEVVANVGTVLSSTIDREAERDFSKLLKHHKAKVLTGVSVALAATAATTAARFLGASYVKEGLGIASNTLLGAGSGFLRSKIRGYLNPIADKLRKSDDKKFKDALNEQGTSVVNDEVMVKQAIDAVIKSEKNKGALEQGTLEEIKASLKNKDEFKGLSDEQQEEIARGMFCLNEIANNNNKKLAEFLEKEHKNVWDKVKGTWAGMSPTVRGAALGAAFGSIATASKAIAESGIASGAISGIVSGAMMGGSIKNYYEKKNIEGQARGMMEEIDSFDSGKEQVKVGKLRIYLESGALDKHPLAKEKAKALLMEKLLGENVVDAIDKDFDEETEKAKLREKFTLSGTKKKLAYAAGISLGVLMGSGTATAMTNYAEGGFTKDVVDVTQEKLGDATDVTLEKLGDVTDATKTKAFENNAWDYSSGKVAETFGLSESDLKGFDVDNDGEYNVEEVAAAQSRALGLDETHAIKKPISAAEYQSLVDVKDFVSQEAIHKVLEDNQVTSAEVESLQTEKIVEENRRVLAEKLESSRMAEDTQPAGEPLAGKLNSSVDVAAEESMPVEDKALLEKLNTQKATLGGLDAGTLLNDEQIAVINKYQEVLSDDKFSEIIKDGLDNEEIVKLNEDIATKYYNENGVRLDAKKVAEIMDGDNKGFFTAGLEVTVASKQSAELGVGNIIKPLSSEDYSTLKAYSVKPGIDNTKIIKEALDQKIYDRVGLEKLVLKDETGIKLSTFKKGVMIKEFDKIVGGDMEAINYAKIPRGGSISEVLGQSMSADSKVVLINTDGSLIKNFDANLVHEDDLLVTKGDEIYVFKTSGIKVSEGDSLEGIYDKIDEQLEAEGIPEKFKERYGQSDGSGEFSKQVDRVEAKELLKDWGSFTPEQQAQLRGGQLSPEHVDAILEKGKWVESWTTVGAGDTVETSYISISSGDSKSPTSFELKVSDSKLNDGIPDEVEANSILAGYKRTFERGAMKADDFSEAVTTELNRVGDVRADKLILVLAENGNISVDELNASGIKMYNGDKLDKTFETKVEFWNNHIRPLDTPAKARDFFTLLDRMEIDVTEEHMKFIIDGDAASMQDRAEAISFVDVAGIDISYSDALNYRDTLYSFDNLEQVEAAIKMINGENPDVSMKKLFGVEASTKYSYDKDTGVYKLHDVKLGKNGEKVNILLTKDEKGNMKFGYDGAALFNEGTKGNWNSIRPDTELSGENIDKLQDNLNKKFATARANQAARSNQESGK